MMNILKKDLKNNYFINKFNNNIIITPIKKTIIVSLFSGFKSKNEKISFLCLINFSLHEGQLLICSNIFLQLSLLKYSILYFVLEE